jgi:hypothetical protein
VTPDPSTLRGRETLRVRLQVHLRNEPTIEFDWGGCLLTDEGSVDEIDALIGGEAHYLGRKGTVESLRLIEGTVPWPGPPWPRPVYRVRWTPSP